MGSEMCIRDSSRVANSKYIETPYGTKLLKSFFSESLTKSDGGEVSTIEIKKILKNLINKENKNSPLTDINLSKELNKKGYIEIVQAEQFSEVYFKSSEEAVH